MATLAITGTLVPEPCGVVLVGLGVAGYRRGVGDTSCRGS
jgi:hypothetical protein